MTCSGAREIVAAVASGAVSAREIVETHIRRIEEVNASLNALVVPLFDQARRDAAAVDEARSRGEKPGALAGVPFTVKEAFDVAGTPTTLGLTTLAKHRAGADAECVARLRQAGAIRQRRRWECAVACPCLRYPRNQADIGTIADGRARASLSGAGSHTGTGRADGAHR